MVPSTGAAFPLEPIKTDEEALPVRITRRLRRAIAEGELVAGARLPSEPVLARQLGVSRASLREALQVLERERLLSRRPGIGTYLTAHADLRLQRGLDELYSTTELIEGHGFRAGTADATARPVTATEQLASELEVDVGAPLLHLSRTRLADGAPVIQCEEYLPLALLRSRGVDPSELGATGSLYEFFDARLGRRVVLTRTTVLPAVATSTLAARLRIPRGHPLLLLEQIHFAADQRPVLVSRNYHNPDVIQFRIIRRSSR